MMFSTREFLMRAQLDETTLEIWVAEGWLVPAPDDAAPYRESDLARARLIEDLTIWVSMLKALASSCISSIKCMACAALWRNM